MKKIKFTLIALFIGVIAIQAQENEKKEFVPSGKPFVKIFSNGHSTFIDGENTSAFEVQRAYFGYSYSLSENFSAKLTLDVGDPKDDGKLEMTAYLKNAALEYKTGNLKVNFGLIGLYGFKAQEKQWGYRYIYKSFQDEHKFGSSADLGVSAVYKFADFLSADVMVINGEGYKKNQSDNTYKGALGVTVTPVKNLNLRIYYDYMRKNEAQQTIALFAGYKADKFRVGAEYNILKNNDYIKENDLNGISFYTTIVASKKLNFFGRFDSLTSKDGWNEASDGQAYIVGLEYKAAKGVKISPNYKGWNPSLKDAPMVSSAYLNLEISF